MLGVETLGGNVFFCVPQVTLSSWLHHCVCPHVCMFEHARVGIFKHLHVCIVHVQVRLLACAYYTVKKKLSY